MIYFSSFIAICNEIRTDCKFPVKIKKKNGKKNRSPKCVSLSSSSLPSVLFITPIIDVGEQCAGVGSILCVLRPARCQRHYPGGGRFDCSRWGKNNGSGEKLKRKDRAGKTTCGGGGRRVATKRI